MEKNEKLKAQRRSEVEAISELTIISTELASSNIKKYLELHESAAARRNMKMYDDMFEQTSKALDESVLIAQKNIEQYLKLKS